MVPAPSAPPLAVVLDVGGTSVAAALLEADGHLRRTVEGPIDEAASARDIVARLSAVIDRQLASIEVPMPVAIAFPGPFDYDAGVPLLEHKFRALHGLELGMALDQALTRPHGEIRFCNDAAAAGTGEAWLLGADTGRIWVLLFGTGLGSALIADGRFVARDADVDTTELWRCTIPGTRRAADEVFSARGLAVTLGVTPSELAATLAPRPLEREIEARLSEWTDDLAAFCRWLLTEHPADRFILGGGVSRSLDRFGPQLSASIDREVSAASVGGHPALIGAALACGLALAPPT